jgi:hypothetical protein
MSIPRIVVPALVASLLAATSFAPSMAQTAPSQTQPYCGPGWGGSPMNFLTSEQRMMHFAEVQKATAGMSFDQMRDYRLSMRSKVMAMTAAERQQYAAALSAKWNALSAGEKVKIQQQFTSFRNGRPMGRGMGRGMGGGMGRGMGGDCWW